VPVLAALADVRDRFFALCLDAGRQVLTAMTEQAVAETATSLLAASFKISAVRD
jgi:hypothetical protein